MVLNFNQLVFYSHVQPVEHENSKSSSSSRGKKTTMKKVMEYCYEPEMEEVCSEEIYVKILLLIFLYVLNHYFNNFVKFEYLRRGAVLHV